MYAPQPREFQYTGVGGLWAPRSPSPALMSSVSSTMSYGDSDDEQDAQLQLAGGVGEQQVAFCAASAALHWGALCGGAGVGSEDVPTSLADVNAFFARHGEMPSSGKGASAFERI